MKEDRRPNPQKRVKFSGRSAHPSRRRTKDASPASKGKKLGAWRAEIRKTTRWDQRSLIALGSVAGVVFLLLIAMVLGVRAEFRKQALTPSGKPQPDGVRVELPLKPPPDVDPDYLESEVKGREYLVQTTTAEEINFLLEEADLSEDPEAAALALSRAAFLYETTQQDRDAAMDFYDQVLENYPQTSSAPRALIGKIRVLDQTGADQWDIESAYEDALSKLNPSSPTVASICRDAMRTCREDSRAHQLAKDVLATAEGAS